MLPAPTVDFRLRTFRLLGAFSLFLPLLASSADVSPGPAEVRIIRFEDIKPPGARLTTCWDALGIDAQQRVYIAISDQSEEHPFDTAIFRYDTRTEGKELLGTLRQISREAGNLLEGETIAKIHVPFQEYGGKFYVSSHDYHTYKGNADLAKRRGGHFYAFDIASGKFDDLSKSDAGGVSVAQQGIIGLTVIPGRNCLAGLTYPFGDILVHDLTQHRTTFYQGVAEHRQSNRPTRHIFANERKVFFSYYDRRESPVYAFNFDTQRVEETPLRFHFGMTYGAIPTRDRSRIYLVDLFGNLYAFHTREETLEDLGSLLPAEQIAAGVKVEICYALVLSADETRLYTVPSRLSIAPALRIYESNVKTGEKRQVADLTAQLNGSSKGTKEDREGRITGGVSDEKGRMYFGYHESGDDGRNGALIQITLPGGAP